MTLISQSMAESSLFFIFLILPTYLVPLFRVGVGVGVEVEAELISAIKMIETIIYIIIIKYMTGDPGKEFSVLSIVHHNAPVGNMWNIHIAYRSVAKKISYQKSLDICMME
jgi:hypothetical protein